MGIFSFQNESKVLDTTSYDQEAVGWDSQNNNPEENKKREQKIHTKGQ